LTQKEQIDIYTHVCNYLFCQTQIFPNTDKNNVRIKGSFVWFLFVW